MRFKRKLLSIIMTAAMITTLFAGLTISASATPTNSDYWTSYDSSSFQANYDTSWYTASGAASPYSLTDAADLAGLVAIVNGTAYKTNSAGYILDSSDNVVSDILNAVSISQYDFSGDTVNLTNSVNLITHYWNPIGDSSNPFAGTFNGQGKTISNLNVEYISGRLDYYGLFGYSIGPILNLTVNGEIDLSDAPSSVTIGNVGGIVGYTTSDVYNCHTNVTITADRATKVGGVVGQINRTDTTDVDNPFHIRACSAKGNITALSRAGGIVGDVECNKSGNVIVDYSFYASGTSTLAKIETKSGSKVWSGGVVGYCKGKIEYCYAVAQLKANGGHYICGIVGLLNGSNPRAELGHSYAAVTLDGATGYDRPIFGSCDNSNVLSISHVLYDSDLAATNGSYTQPIATGANKWGFWTQVGYAGTTAMQNNGNATVYTSTGSGYTSETKKVLDVLGTNFVQDSNTVNAGYPVLAWQNGATKPGYVAGVAGTVASETGVFLNGVSGSDSNTGLTRDNAVKTIDVALAKAVSNSVSTIYVLNTVSLTGQSGLTELNLSGSSYNNITFKRSVVNTGYLFNIPSTVSAIVSEVTIDGNKSKVYGAESLFHVSGGDLTISTSASLTNNISSDGGAVTVESGSLTMSGGTITNNDANRGGAVYIYSGASFSLSNGTISGNTAASPGGAVCSRGTFTMSGGTLSGNTADNGGAIAVMAGTTTLTSAVSSSAITGNTAIYGAGVYENAGATFEYAGSGIASGQEVYLANTSGNSDAYITMIGTPTVNITVKCANPVLNTTKVAEAVDNYTSTLSYVGNAYGFVGNENQNTSMWDITLATYSAS